MKSNTGKNPTPLISVVTVVYNDINGIAGTLQSVSEQDTNNYEFIVIDGASTDGTIELITSHQADVDVFISEKDTGIYDAMNKGIKHCNGDYVIFMNSGDTFVDSSTLPKFMEIIQNNRDCDVFYGDRIYLAINGKERYDKARDIKTVLERMPYFHQSVFIKRSVLNKYPFNQTYRFAGDYNQAVEIYLGKHKYKYIAEPVCKYLEGGKSESGIAPYLEALKIQIDNSANVGQLQKSQYMQAFINNFDDLVQPYVLNKNTPKRANNNAPSSLNMALLEQLDFDKVLYADRNYLKKISETEKLKVRDIWVEALMHFKLDFGSSKNAHFMFMHSMEREDYSELLYKIMACSGYDDNIILENFMAQQQKHINMKASQIIIDMKSLYYSFEATTSAERACLYLKLCEYILILQEALKHGFKTLVCFADMQPVENLVAQYIRLTGRITVTLQHGLYVDYKEFETVNKINYLHHVSEYFLAWGKDTANLIQKFHPQSNIKVCGKPAMTVSEQPNANRIKNLDFKYCTVVFDQKIFDKENAAMLRLASDYAKKHGIKVNVKFHPQNLQKHFRALGIDFEVALDLLGSEFVLGHTSSLIYELMGRGCKVFKFKSTAPCLTTPPEIVFSSVADIEKGLNNNFDYKKSFSDYIKYKDEASLVQYRKAFKEISSGE